MHGKKILYKQLLLLRIKCVISICLFRFLMSDTQSSSVANGNACVMGVTNELSHTHHMIIQSDLCEKVTCVGGVLLSREITDVQVVRWLFC